MKVIVPLHTGFCPGVKRAERIAFEEKRKGRRPIFVLGDFIHNEGYIDYLRQNGIRTVPDLEQIPPGATVVIRTHGLDRLQEARLRERFEVVDLTCSTVKRLQLYIRRHADDGFYVVITGKRSHPEVRGLVSYARDSYVVETEDDLRTLLEDDGALGETLRAGNHRGILVVSQTTGRRVLFDETVEQIAGRFGESAQAAAHESLEVKSFDSICGITSLRETEALANQDSVDASFVVGDRISSNATRLYETLRNRDERTYFVRNRDELEALDLAMQRFSAVQVVSSSSTPDFLERDIIAFLESI